MSSRVNAERTTPAPSKEVAASESVAPEATVTSSFTGKLSGAWMTVMYAVVVITPAKIIVSIVRRFVCFCHSAATSVRRRLPTSKRASSDLREGSIFYFGRFGGGCAFLARMRLTPGDLMLVDIGCHSVAMTSVDIRLSGSVNG